MRISRGVGDMFKFALCCKSLELSRADLGPLSLTKRSGVPCSMPGHVFLQLGNDFFGCLLDKPVDFDEIRVIINGYKVDPALLFIEICSDVPPGPLGCWVSHHWFLLLFLMKCITNCT